MNIFNFFGETLSWYIFTQGLFFTFVLYLGGYLIYISHLVNDKKNNKKNKENSTWNEYVDNIKSSIKKSPESKLDVKHAAESFAPFIKSFLGFKLIIFPLILVLIFTIGIVVYTVSDAWMDDTNTHHLGLKSYWANNYYDTFSEQQLQDTLCEERDRISVNNYLDYANTDQGIKLTAFDRIFRNHKFICDKNKLQIYYNIKHQLLQSELWRGYISYSQVLINLSQGFVMAFFTLLIISIGNFIYYIIRKKYWISSILIAIAFVLFSLSIYIPSLRILQPYFVLLMILIALVNVIIYKRRKLLISLIFMVISTLGYHFSSISWLSNEYEVCYKTYGVYKATDERVDYNEMDDLFKEEVIQKKNVTLDSLMK